MTGRSQNRFFTASLRNLVCLADDYVPLSNPESIFEPASFARQLLQYVTG